MRLLQAIKRAAETSDQTLHRKQHNAHYKACIRANETSDQTLHRKQHDVH